VNKKIHGTKPIFPNDFNGRPNATGPDEANLPDRRKPPGKFVSQAFYGEESAFGINRLKKK
jgi:hypothetical protein